LITGENKRYILLTFDYELFLGDRSGTVENCMIKPTDQLLKILAKHQVKSIFFIDTLYLFRLRQEGLIHSLAKQDYDYISAQLLKLSADGHYLFHHIHPHWLNATYLPDTNEWDEHDYSHFAISTLDKEERSRVFQISKNELEQIIPGAGSMATGFRAGGLYVQPMTAFIDGFNQAGIRYDFSILPGFKSEEAFYNFDFTEVKEKKPYPFNNDILPDANGSFIEFPISTYEVKGALKIVNSLWHRLIVKNFLTPKWGDGIGSKNKIFPAKKNPFFRATEACSVENLNPFRRIKYQNYLRQHAYLHIISHPKLISKSQLCVLDKFLDIICKRYSIEFDFMKFATHT